MGYTLGRTSSTKPPECAMSDSNEFLDLPPDSEEAFAVYQRRRMAELEEVWENGRNSGWHAEREYVDDLMAFDEVHGLGIFAEFSPPPARDDPFSEWFQQFRRHAQIASRKILIEVARRINAGETDIVALDGSTKTAIHQLISQIREEIYRIRISDELKESLLAKLNAFAREVDRTRTRTEAFYAAAHQFARNASQFGEEIEPLIKKVDRISAWLDKATKWKDALPKWSERRQIEKPRPQIEDQRFGSDEIPF